MTFFLNQEQSKGRRRLFILIEPDKGNFFRDPSAARYPTYPMEPAVQAVLRQTPQFPTEKRDIFTCTSALVDLSRFVRGVEREFRFIMEMV